MVSSRSANGHSDGGGSASPALHFGRQVLKERKAQGWTTRDLARVTGLNPGHISRIERGVFMITERVAGAMDKAFPHREGWFSEYQTDSQQWAPPGYRSLTDYENKSSRMRLWCPSIINGIAQTEAYARALLATFPGATPEVIDARAKTRLERQQRILHRDDPPSVWLLIDEPALFRLVGSPEIMAAQMDRLLELAALPDVTMQVVPAVGHAATPNEIINLDDLDAVYCEHVGRGFIYTDDETVTSLDRLVTKLQAESYRESESVRIVEEVRDIWTTATDGVSLLSALRTAGRVSK